MTIVSHSRFQRVNNLLLVLGIVTILCHATGFVPAPQIHSSLHFNNIWPGSDERSPEKKPDATDDAQSTAEDSPTTFNVLANDRGGDDGGPGPGGGDPD